MYCSVASALNFGVTCIVPLRRPESFWNLLFGM
jgi:hypothetical protein